jgi:hypothetical protein
MFALLLFVLSINAYQEISEKEKERKREREKEISPDRTSRMMDW